MQGPHTDPYNYLKRKLREAEHKKVQKKPLMSNERMQKKLNEGLPYLITSLSEWGKEREGGRRGEYCFLL